VLVLEEEEEEDQDDAISFSSPALLKAERAYGCRLSRPLTPVRTWQRRPETERYDFGKEGRKKERKKRAPTATGQKKTWVNARQAGTTSDEEEEESKKQE
jgi:hypothetical protein